MALQIWLHTFLNDTKVHIVFVLLILDFILGVIAAVAKGIFRLSYVSDFLRNDVIFKVIPYFTLYAAALVAGGEAVVPGFDFGLISGAAYAILVAAFVGSILSSLRTLGLLKALPDLIAGPENHAPPKS
jgi:hypothetical protein